MAKGIQKTINLNFRRNVHQPRPGKCQRGGTNLQRVASWPPVPLGATKQTCAQNKNEEQRRPQKKKISALPQTNPTRTQQPPN